MTPERESEIEELLLLESHLVPRQELCVALRELLSAFRSERDAYRKVSYERDAYRKAKAENDERFMIERDEARGKLTLAKEKIEKEIQNFRSISSQSPYPEGSLRAEGAADALEETLKWIK